MVTNFKNTRIFCTVVQNFGADGTHNVKKWYKYFTPPQLLFGVIAYNKCLSPNENLSLCSVDLSIELIASLIFEGVASCIKIIRQANQLEVNKSHTKRDTSRG